MTDQQALRRRLKQLRRSLPTRQAIQAQNRVLHRLQRHTWFRRAQRVAGYVGSNGEIDPMPLLARVAGRNKRVYLPVLHPFREGRLWFCEWRPGDHLHPNRFGIAEPTRRGAHMRPARALDLVIVPMLGFDEACNRLGMGGGYYDRTFAFRLRPQRTRRPLLLGVAYEFQRVERLDPQRWDVALDAIVTERRLYRRPGI
ncbi:MAG: 5-formyltetrahydrofolate cyclo-ligase [Gammaproteobacteria bacterium]|nr:5-formyltetrahydrofolate cyclo-ligase [Gammaproteobacteria bacterium]